MAILLPPEPKGDYTPAPGGSHIAACYSIVDLGTQGYAWQGEMIISRQIAFFFELQNELMENGKPYTIALMLPLKSGKKAKLRIFLEAWRSVPFTDADFGKFDLKKLLGIGCMLGITQETKESKIRSKIQTIMRLPKGTAIEKLVNPEVFFDLNEFDQAIYDNLGEFWKTTIAKSPEYKHLKGIGSPHDEADITGHLNVQPDYSQDEGIPF